MSSLPQMIIANWKMNLTLEETDKICNIVSSILAKSSLVIAPPTPYIAYLKAKYENLDFCAQDVSIKDDFGAYTGENSAKFFKSCGINYAIIGHSERRNLFGENNDVIKQKAENCIHNDITPIICIGESLEVRKSGKYKEFLIKQLEKSLPKNRHCEEQGHKTSLREGATSHRRSNLRRYDDITPNLMRLPRSQVVARNDDYSPTLIIAYEPVWAIGTKITPTINEIKEILDLIRNSETVLDYKSQLVYGGSVSSGNCKNILETQNISGLLVGSAALNAEELIKILNS